MSYNSQLKPSSQDCNRLENYALLAALLMYRYGESPHLKPLNAVLELVDLLSSVGLGEASALTRSATLAAVEGEIAAVQRLLVDHGVRL